MSITLKIKGFANRKDGFFILVIGGILVLIITAQQVIPSGQPIPFARIDGNLVRIRSSTDIVNRYHITEDRELTLKIQDYSATYKLRDLGISLDESATIEPYIVQSRLKRLIPFSVLAHMYRDNKPSYVSSQKSLFIVTSAIADQVNIAPTNASLTYDDQKITIQPSKPGVIFEPEKATFSIFDAIEQGKDSVLLVSKQQEASISTDELNEAVSKFSASLPDSISITLGSSVIPLTKSTMESWLSYTEADGLPEIKFDTSKVQNYVDSLGRQYASDQQPTATIVSLTDGKETGRIAGRAGKSIIAKDLVDTINSALKSKQISITATLVDVPSPITYTRTYTRSSAGLKDLLDQITAGKEVSVRFVDMNSRGWIVGSNEHAKSNMASTYKMFVTYSVLKRIDEGSMNFNDSVNGQTIDTCLQKIIIDSNNECAIALAERIGWLKIADEGRAIGAVDLDWSKELIGSAYDASIVPIKLARGEILTATSRNYMIDLMKRQRFRSGIPSGTSNVVADKVGFIDGWLNDAGIVYAPELPYVLSIYTNHESWGLIAEITRQVESLVR